MHALEATPGHSCTQPASVPVCGGYQDCWGAELCCGAPLVGSGCDCGAEQNKLLFSSVPSFRDLKWFFQFTLRQNQIF